MNDEQRKKLREFNTHDGSLVVWRAEQDGFVATIEYDQESGSGDPRDGDNLSMIVHWHSRHGIASDAEDIVQAVGGRDNLPDTLAGVEQWLRDERGAVAVVPLAMIDHSGISFYVGTSNHPADPGGWDSGQVGFVYTTAERVRELCGEYPYKPSDYKGTADEWLEEQLREDVRILDAYAQNNVFFHQIVDPEGNVVEDCYGYLVVSDEHGDGLDFLREEAYSLLLSHAGDEAREREWAAVRDIATR